MTTTGAPDGTPPSTAGQPHGQRAPSSSQVNLSWSASTDNVAVTGYNVYRNGVLLPTAVTPDATPATTYTDDTASPGTSYTYQVTAVDAAGNESARAAVTVVTAGGSGGTLTFAPTDDATIDASQPTVNFGTATRLTVDNSPVNSILLKFNVSGTAGCPISSAKLRMTVGSTTNDNSVYGGDLYGTGTSWNQSSVTWNTAPAASGAKVSSVATAVALNTSYLFDATSLVTGDGAVGIMIKSPNSDGARYFSNESGTPAQVPQLQVACGGDSTPPTPPANLAATAASSTQVNLSWTPSTDNVGVTGYKVYRNQSATALAILPGSATSYTDNTAKAATSYSYQVTALDAVGNQSTRSSTNVTTPSSGNDFSVTAAPNPVSVTAGQSTTSTISTAVTSGSAQSVALTATGQPAATTVSFNPATITAGQTSTMTIATGAGTPAGTSNIVVTATGSSAVHTKTVALTVNAPVADDFSVTAAPNPVSVTAGQSTTSTISTAVTSGSAQSVALTATGQPAATTVSFNPATITAGQTSTMTIATGAGTPTGTSNIVVTATGPSAVHTKTVALTVNAPSAGPQLVQSAAGTAAATSSALTATFPSATGTGHLLVVAASLYTGATNHVTSVTDSAGDTWTRVGSYFQSGHNSDGELWFTVASAPSSTVTVHTATAASMVFQVQEFSGVVTTNPLDTSAGASNTGTTAASGNLTPAAPHDLLVGFVAGHGNTQQMTVTTAGLTVAPQQTTTGTAVTIRTGYQALSSASPVGISATFTTAMYWAAGVAAFRAVVDQP